MQEDKNKKIAEAIAWLTKTGGSKKGSTATPPPNNDDYSKGAPLFIRRIHQQYRPYENGDTCVVSTKQSSIPIPYNADEYTAKEVLFLVHQQTLSIPPESLHRWIHAKVLPSKKEDEDNDEQKKNVELCEKKPEEQDNIVEDDIPVADQLLPVDIVAVMAQFICGRDIKDYNV